jgi:hypothetical protein
MFLKGGSKSAYKVTLNLYGDNPTFRRNKSPPSSVSNCKPTKKPAEADGEADLHDAIYQNVMKLAISEVRIVTTALCYCEALGSIVGWDTMLQTGTSPGSIPH